MENWRRWSFLPAVVLAAAACQQRAEPPRGDAAQAAAAAPAQSAAPAVQVRRDNPCSVLMPQEVESILGGTVPGREIVDEVTCSFPFGAPPGRSTPGGTAPGTTQAPANDRETEATAKSLAASFAGGPPQLIVKVYFKDGRTTMAANRMANSLLGGFEQLPDLGDEAWLGPMASTLMFRKGDVGVELDLRMVPDAKDKGIRLAKLIASRL
jgi:hypothetical protein